VSDATTDAPVDPRALGRWLDARSLLRGTGAPDVRALGEGHSNLTFLVSRGGAELVLRRPPRGPLLPTAHDVVREARRVQTLINRVSVEASFFKKLSPLENLMYGARLYGLGAPEARDGARRILIRLGLEPAVLEQPMEEMSRGMQQKVAIARAFLSSPILLLLDEPTTGLDPRSKREVQTFVRELRDTHDATVLLTTHDMVEAEALCDRVAIIHGGRIVALDTPEALKAAAPRLNGHSPTLEDVFLSLTGAQLVEFVD